MRCMVCEPFRGESRGRKIEMLLICITEQITEQPAYFKSTDGHFNNWSFNLRRPNIHLLKTIERRKGSVSRIAAQYLHRLTT